MDVITPNKLFATPKSTGEIEALINGLPKEYRGVGWTIAAMTNNYLAAQFNPEYDALVQQLTQLQNDCASCAQHDNEQMKRMIASAVDCQMMQRQAN